MTIDLRHTRILIADDQPDVAETLFAPLRRSGVMLKFAGNGEDALALLDAEPYDLLVVDMKMPPGDWGGLWLLKELQSNGWRMPVLVLSGEGTKRQTIEAIRLGADDWIDKSEASTELRERCLVALQQAYLKSLDRASIELPTPLAVRFAAYARAVDADKQTTEGFRALEAILRFCAILGFSSTSPRPLRGVRPSQIARPSTGTWFTICTGLAEVSGVGKTFLNLLSCLMPDSSSRSQVQEQIRIRNAVAHSNYTLTEADLKGLNELLTRFAHRAGSSWRAAVVVPMSMTYDGTTYTISGLSLVGTDLPKYEEIRTGNAIRTGQPFLFGASSEPLPMSPWLVTQTTKGPASVQCLIFGGVKTSKLTALKPDDPLVYSRCESGESGVQPTEPPGLLWSAISSWIAG